MAISGVGGIRDWWTFRLETHENLRLAPSETAKLPLLRSLQYHTFLDKVDHDNLVTAIRNFKARK